MADGSVGGLAAAPEVRQEFKFQVGDEVYANVSSQRALTVSDFTNLPVTVVSVRPDEPAPNILGRYSLSGDVIEDWFSPDDLSAVPAARLD